MTTPHKSMLIQARDALLSACGGRCNAEYNPCDYKEVADALTAAIDAPEPEPVEYQMLILGERWVHCAAHLYRPGSDAFRALYDHPAPRQPLTDAEIDTITVAQWGEQIGAMLAAYRAYARAIESKIGAKP